MCPRGWIVSGAVLAFLAVALGAFGAHGLPDYLASQQVSSEDIARQLDRFETGARYHMYHALAVMLVGLIAQLSPSRGVQVAGYSFLVGILLFSGCLYAYAFTGVRTFGAIVPLGGVAMLVGWLALAWGARQFCKDDSACTRPSNQPPA